MKSEQPFDFTSKLSDSEQLASFIRRFQTDDEFTKAFYAAGNKYGDYSEQALATLLALRKSNQTTQITKP